MKELLSYTSLAASLALATRTADANGSGVDLQGYSSALVLGIVGPEGDTLSGSDSISIELEESDDNSTFTDVAAADMKIKSPAVAGSSGQFGLADTNSEAPIVFQCAYLGSKRYIRVVDNRTGTHSTGTLTGGYVLRGTPSVVPAT